jgi:hypothetical protein
MFCVLQSFLNKFVWVKNPFHKFFFGKSYIVDVKKLHSFIKTKGIGLSINNQRWNISFAKKYSLSLVGGSNISFVVKTYQ